MIIKSYIILFLLSLHSLNFAQFNTLNFVPKETESNTTVKEGNPSLIQNKNQKKWRLFRRKNTQQSLKNELDSLKRIISKIKHQKAIPIQQLSSHLEDSILYYLKQNNSPSTKTPTLKKMDIIKEKLHRFHLPVDKNLKITSSYGMRIHPISKKNQMHNGIDIRAHFENVYAVLDGVISQSSYNQKNGHFIKIQHAHNYETIYLHLSHQYYAVGEKVNAGFIIGRSGNSGASTAPHLHFSVKRKGQFINPIQFLNNIIKLNNLIANIYE